MLTRWSVANFKAISDEIELQLAPITVLAGANSSGKSTLLQSILLVSQTLRAKPGEQPVLLNGEYVRLGYISDIVHDGNTKQPFLFGFDLVQKSATANEHESASEAISPIRLRAEIYAENVEGEQSRTRVKSLLLQWGGTGEFSLVELQNDHKNSISRYPNIQTLPDTRDEIQHGTFSNMVTSHSYGFSFIEPFRPQASLRHFLPARVLETYDAKTEIVKRSIQNVIDVIGMREDEMRRNPKIFDELDISLEDTIGELLKETLRNGLDSPTIAMKERGPESMSKYPQERLRAIAVLRYSSTLREWVEYIIKEIHLSYRKTMAENLLLYLARIHPQKKNLKINEVGARSTRLPSDMRYVIEQLIEHFSNYTYYLGPLREAPQFIYNLPPYPEVTHVGLKGEFTASVFAHFKGTKVEYPQPPSLMGKGDGIDVAPLAYALQVWLDYMGLLEDVSTTDRGKMGTELAVRAQGVNRVLDLTSIGVGVSQVLPTLVMGLIAPKGTVFLLEQPELHLHPKVQSILADFLLGLTRVGKQCIIETHSEYLINRLRRRVAEDPTNTLAEDIAIYFVARERGKSSFRKVDLNSYGAVIEWPRGFFDEGPSESQMIMEAAMRKRRVER